MNSGTTSLTSWSPVLPVPDPAQTSEIADLGLVPVSVLAPSLPAGPGIDT